MEQRRPDKPGYSQEFSDTVDSIVGQIGTNMSTSLKAVKRKSATNGPEVSKNESRVELDHPETDQGELSPALRVSVLACINKAMEIMGRTGRDVFFEILQRRYGVSEVDIVDYPGKFMTALKLMFDTSAYVIESHILDEIYRSSGVKGVSLEDVVATLRSRAPEVLQDCKVDAIVDPVRPDTTDLSQKRSNPIQDFLSQVEIQNSPKPKEGFSYHYAKKANDLSEQY